MKTKTFFTIASLLFLVYSSHAQGIYPHGKLIFNDTLTFSPLNSWITISSSNKVWEIGIPNKAGMKGSYDDSSAIVTKLNEVYPLNSSDYFEIAIPYKYVWGEGILSFWHKYDTDSLKDGGLIEVSNDGGNTWENIIQSNYGLARNYIGLYGINDTINGGIHAFTGRSNSWKKVELYWFWLALTKSASSTMVMMLRFKFISSDKSSPRNGWELSHFEFKGYSILGGVNADNVKNTAIFPNPATDKIKINLPNFNDNYTFRLYNQNGVELLNLPVKTNNQEITIKQFANGIYLYTISQKGLLISTGQIIKK